MTGGAAKSPAVVVPHAPTCLQRSAARVLVALERVMTATIRMRVDDRSGLIAGGIDKPVIMCLWHNRLALSMYLYRGLFSVPMRGRGLAALVSASRDGAFLAAVLEQFGMQPVRGSSSRRGPQALLELTGWIERGYSVAITPDGPRGPRYAVQRGVMSLAQLTGVPVVPVSYHLSRKITLKSWDRFQLPLPFARCELVIGQPLHVPREASDEERNVLRRELEARLNAITRD